MFKKNDSKSMQANYIVCLNTPVYKCFEHLKKTLNYCAISFPEFMGWINGSLKTVTIGCLILLKRLKETVVMPSVQPIQWSRFIEQFNEFKKKN